MGQLFPPSAKISDIDDQYERRFVERLVRHTDNDWFIIPNYHFHDGHLDRETDVVVVHRRFGVGVIEVKGGLMTIRNGQWLNNGERDEPDGQARKNSFGVRHILRDVITPQTFKVAWGVALPMISEVEGRLPGEMMREQLFLGSEADDLEERLEQLFEATYSTYALTNDELTRVLGVLLPDVDFTYDPDALRRYTRAQLLVAADAQVEALMSLDAHARVLVTGRAGTGKTYLASRWAMKGMITQPDETPKRVLLTCYSDPLGMRLREGFSSFEVSDEDDTVGPSLMVGPFLRLVTELEGMPPVDFPFTDDYIYWHEKLLGFVLANWQHVTARFDRIIVDRAQDFSPAWIGLLESLLDPLGDNKFFLFSDDAQRLMDRGFVEPSIEAGWVRVELANNVRNSREIARLVRRSLDGAVAPQSLPSSGTIQGRRAMSDDDVVFETRLALGAALADEYSPRDLMVVTSDTALRNRMREELALVRAEEWSATRVACELSQRAKGLEAALTIVAVGERGMSDAELYVALSRAVEDLTVIGPEELLGRLGLN